MCVMKFHRNDKGLPGLSREVVMNREKKRCKEQCVLYFMFLDHHLEFMCSAWLKLQSNFILHLMDHVHNSCTG